ncbi:MAG: 30S ribosomal protein S2 [Myxococcota bacterium]|nr:30S ribosomal protein S2 [Myxococcota bacterium]
MSETTVEPSAADDVSAAAPVTPAAAPEETAESAMSVEKAELSIRSLLEAGAHFGHLTQRWDPRMRHYIFGARNGTHILDLDQTLPLFREALSYLEDVAAGGGHVLFVGTKRQAADIVRREALRSGQYYVNNRWLGGMLTNWKTVKKSIDSYKGLLEILGDEEKRAEYSKKELSRITRLCEKYQKSLEGIKEMQRIPDAMFVIDVSREDIAITEARRLGIPIVAIVDSNCSPRGIDFVIPGNDDATRAIDLYCRCVADRCLEGASLHQQQLIQQKAEQPAEEKPKSTTGRRVVEIKQAPRRSRGASGRTHTSGGWGDKRGGDSAAGGEPVAGDAPAPAAEAPAPETEGKTS